MIELPEQLKLKAKTPELSQMKNSSIMEDDDILVIEGSSYCDDRGFVRSINGLDLQQFKRMYTVENHEKGFIRAWHGHRKETKAVICLKGSAVIGLVKFDSPYIESNEYPTKIVISSTNPTAIIIPPGFANGALTLTDDCILLYLSDNSLTESSSDDIRFPWDHWGTNFWDINYR